MTRRKRSKLRRKYNKAWRRYGWLGERRKTGDRIRWQQERDELWHALLQGSLIALAWIRALAT